MLVSVVRNKERVVKKCETRRYAEEERSVEGVKVPEAQRLGMEVQKAIQKGNGVIVGSEVISKLMFALNDDAFLIKQFLREKDVFKLYMPYT